MNKQLIVNQLIQFGLEKDETDIYLALLQNGPLSPLEISRETNINRTRVYRLLELLTLKNLVEETPVSWGKKVKAKPAENLELLVKEQENNLKNKQQILPELLTSLSLLSPQTTDQFEVKYYKGVDGLKQMIWNDLKSKEVLAYGVDTINAFVGKTFGDLARAEAVSRNIKYKEILNSEYLNPVDYNGAAGWDNQYEFKVISEKVLKIRHAIEIYNDTVAIMNWWSGELSGVEIINKDLAEMQRQIFWQFWKIAK